MMMKMIVFKIVILISQILILMKGIINKKKIMKVKQYQLRVVNKMMNQMKMMEVEMMNLN